MSVRFGPSITYAMILIRTLASGQAKKTLGQVNHFLLTSLIGLNHLRSASAVDLTDLPGQWNPKDQDASITRSQRFLRSATLVWMIDALDEFMVSVSLEHSSLFDEPTRKIIEARGVYPKFKVLRPFHDKVGSDLCSALVGTAALWRNRLVHHSAEDRLPSEIRGRLKRMSKHERDTFRGLDPNDLLERFNRSDVPRLKEVASFVQASASWIMDLDRHLVSMIDSGDYATTLLKRYLLKSRQRSKFAVARRDKRTRIITTLLRTYGFDSIQDKGSNSTSSLSVLEEILDMERSDLEAWAEDS